MIFIAIENKEINKNIKTASELYLNFVKDRPQITQIIQLNHIASYLGITPQALSRIRKKLDLEKNQSNNLKNTK